MKEKKNIDEIFQHGFENLDLSPSPQVWETIQAKLEKKKSEKKVIPLWIRLGGIAAGLALMVTLGNLVFNSTQTHPEISDEQLDNNPVEIQNDIIPSFQNNDVVTTDNEDSLEETTDRFSQENPSSVTSQSKKKTLSDSKIASTGKNSKTQTNNTSPVASGNNSQYVPEGKNSAEDVKNNKDVFNKHREEQVVSIETDNTNEEEEKDTSDKRPSLFDAIADQNAIATTSKETQTPDNRWKVTPNLAPVYYSSFGNGSSIDPEFANNPQKGDVNMSYGVQVSYALNDKFSIRTGLNNVDLSYSTSDILIATGPASRGLKAVKYGTQTNVVTAVNKNVVPEGMGNGSYGELNLKNSLGDARLIQELNYFEIPLEVAYKLIDRKFGVNLIGGVSTLLLGENEISVKSDNFSDVLGAANNLSNVSFATNFGIGLNYELSKRFTFNLEPTFKYQLNPYSDSSVDFRPYYLGVYSGLSIRF